MQGLKEYEPITGAQVIEELHLLAQKMSGMSIQNINSTAVGGGVAEILNRMIPLFSELGVKATWDVIKGGEKFFKVTKKFHNALHGKEEDIGAEDFVIFMENNELNLNRMELTGDVLFIHDPQPIGLINRKDFMKSKWIWRCHVDVSTPDERV